MDKVTILIKSERVISLPKLNDIITTAVEGGSNYWYLFNEKADKIIRAYKGKQVPEIHETCFYGTFSEAILPAIMAGEQIPVHDIEESEEQIGILSLENLQTRLQKMADDKRSELEFIYEDSDDDDYDASDADVIFQYLCLGEIVYG